MVVVITGASSGIGKALAEELSRRGAKLGLAARRKDKLDALNAALGGSHLAMTCDVAEADQCEILIQKSAEHFGRIDTVVCNAGYGTSKPVAETTPLEVQRMFATNVFGTIDCARAAVPIFSKQEVLNGYRGQIMIVSSAAARRGLPYFGTYSATKAAQLSISEAMRVELEPRKIAVTSVHPIGTATEFFGVAEQSGHQLPPDSAKHISQTAEQVARKMAQAIARPTTEMWPFAAARWGLSVGTLFPSLVDLAMASARRKIERWNSSKRDVR